MRCLDLFVEVDVSMICKVKGEINKGIRGDSPQNSFRYETRR